jgi:hypothetical protein
MNDVEKSDAKEEMFSAWTYPIKMLSSSRLWKTFLLVFGIPAAVLGVFLMFIAGVTAGLLAFAGGVVFFALVWSIVGVVVDLAGGFEASYVVTNEGVYFKSGKKAQAAANLATVAGALTGLPGVAGAGLLAKSERGAFLAWRNVRKITIDDAGKYIEIRGGFGSKPIGLYCPKDDFQRIRDLVRTKGPATVTA